MKTKRVRCWKCRRLKNKSDVQHLDMRYLKKNITLKTCNTCIASLVSASFQIEMQYRDEQKKITGLTIEGYRKALADIMFGPTPFVKFIKNHNKGG